MFINLKGELQSFKTPIVMGVLNSTEDSFYDGGKYADDRAFLYRAAQILDEGAAILDIGAVSTRPNAPFIDAGTEYNVIKKRLRLLLFHFPNIKISVDTFRAQIAEMAVNEGAAMINDISGGEDPKMFKVIGQQKIPYCLTHNSRNKEITQEQLIPEMLSFFGMQIEQLKLQGVNDIIIDPGFGFGKTIEQNYFLMNNLAVFQQLGFPVLVGISRKSMIYQAQGTTPNEALTGTIALNMTALSQGAQILRVHDIKEAVETIIISQKLKEHGSIQK